MAHRSSFSPFITPPPPDTGPAPLSQRASPGSTRRRPARAVCAHAQALGRSHSEPWRGVLPVSVAFPAAREPNLSPLGDRTPIFHPPNPWSPPNVSRLGHTSPCPWWRPLRHTVLQPLCRGSVSQPVLFPSHHWPDCVFVLRWPQRPLGIQEFCKRQSPVNLSLWGEVAHVIGGKWEDGAGPEGHLQDRQGQRAAASTMNGRQPSSGWPNWGSASTSCHSWARGSRVEDKPLDRIAGGRNSPERKWGCRDEGGTGAGQLFLALKHLPIHASRSRNFTIKYSFLWLR